MSNGITNKTASGFTTTTYNYPSKGLTLMIVEKRSPIFYIITFNTRPEQFKSYWHNIKNTFYSFDVQSTLKDKGLGIRIQPPPHWVRSPNVEVYTPDPH